MVEVALASPILFLVFFGLVEFSRVSMIKAITEDASYYGARAAIVPGGSRTAAETAANSTLAAAYVKNTTVTVEPATITEATESVTVTVSVPLNSNSWIVPNFTKNMVITRSCKLNRE